jgi:hypothetical protein
VKTYFLPARASKKSTGKAGYFFAGTANANPRQASPATPFHKGGLFYSAKSENLLFAGNSHQKIAGQPLVGAELTLRSKVSGDQNHRLGRNLLCEAKLVETKTPTIF